MSVRVKIRQSPTARMARILATLSLPVLVLTGLGNRFGIVGPEALVPLLAIGYLCAVLALAAAVLSLVWIWFSGDRGTGNAMVAIVYATPALAIFGLFVYALYVFPQARDIATDPDDPLLFWSSAMPANANATPTPAAIQTAAYPDIAGRVYPLDMARVYAEIEALLAQKGWAVELRQPPFGPGSYGRIEATAMSPLFAFRNHVAIHVRQIDAGARVDMRSRSHLGRHDAGRNASRIRSFLAGLDKALHGYRDEVQTANQAGEGETGS